MARVWILEQETTVAGSTLRAVQRHRAVGRFSGWSSGRTDAVLPGRSHRELKLGMLGHTRYAETISVYGTEPVHRR